MNVFISSPEYISGIKKTQLRKFMMQGACLDTPLEKKATFNYTWKNIDGEDFVDTVMCYAPKIQNPANHVSKVIVLNSETRIRLIDWYRMTLSVNEYPLWQEENEEADRIRSIIKALEEAAKVHGARQATVANGFIADPEPFLRESGKILKEARAAVYKELDV